MRLINRPLALILALALAVAGVIVIIEVIAFHITSGPLVLHWTTWYHWANKTRWNQLVVQVWSAILIIAGVLILALELKPRRVARRRLRTGESATDAAVTRGGLAGTLRAAATSVDGISSATVSVRRRRVRVAATSSARGRAAAEALRQPVTRAVGDRLDELALHHPPHLSVRVNSRSR